MSDCRPFPLKSARKDTDRKGFVVFSFKSADFADFEMAKSIKPLREE